MAMGNSIESVTVFRNIRYASDIQQSGEPIGDVEQVRVRGACDGGQVGWAVYECIYSGPPLEERCLGASKGTVFASSVVATTVIRPVENR